MTIFACAIFGIVAPAGATRLRAIFRIASKPLEEVNAIAD